MNRQAKTNSVNQPSTDSQNTDPEWSQTQALSWALLDEMISPADLKSLETQLLQSAEARREYLDVVNLHYALKACFSRAESSAVSFPSIPEIQPGLNSGSVV